MLDVIAILMLIAVLGSCIFTICDVLSDCRGKRQSGFQPTNTRPEWHGEKVRSDGNIAQGHSKCHDCKYRDTDNVMYCIKSGCGLPPLPDSKGR